MNALVMNFLVTEGYAEAASAFEAESGPARATLLYIKNMQGPPQAPPSPPQRAPLLPPDVIYRRYRARRRPEHNNGADGDPQGNTERAHRGRHRADQRPRPRHPRGETPEGAILGLAGRGPLPALRQARALD